MSIPPSVQINASFTEIDQYYVLPPTHTLTHDKEARGHIISDEQLMQIAQGGRDVSLDVALGCLGIAAGFSQNLAFAISGISRGTLPSVWDVVGSGVFLIAATAAIVTFLYFLRSGRRLTTIIDEIRNRPVGLMGPVASPYVSGKPFIGEGETTNAD